MDEINNNINNLISLWEIAGQKSGSCIINKRYGMSLAKTGDWPNRVWLHSKLNDQVIQEIRSLKKAVENPIKLSLFETEEENDSQSAHIELVSKQTGMNLNLNEWTVIPFDSVVKLTPVKSPEDSKLWSQLFQQSFGYTIDQDTVCALKEEMTHFVLTFDEKPAGTALLYDTFGTVGIHGIGVIHSMRGKGIAKSAMIQLLNLSKDLLKAKQAALQASDMAVNLYHELGFKKQFVVKNFQINS